MRLNGERLKSNRGVHTAEAFFKDIKFLGKGHESHDLNNIIKRMEHWAHRLYPHFNFDDVISTCEKLGKKKEIQRHMYRYRQGVLEPELIVRNVEDSENMEHHDLEMDPIDELDEIIEQQIQNYSVATKRNSTHPGHDSTFDSIRSTIVGTPKFMDRQQIIASTPHYYVSNELGVRPLVHIPENISVTTSCVTRKAGGTELTSEQRAKIAENRRLAQERLKAKRDH